MFPFTLSGSERNFQLNPVNSAVCTNPRCGSICTLTLEQVKLLESGTPFDCPQSRFPKHKFEGKLIPRDME